MSRPLSPIEMHNLFCMRTARAEELLGSPVWEERDPLTGNSILTGPRGRIVLTMEAIADHPNGTLDELIAASAPWAPCLPSSQDRFRFHTMMIMDDLTSEPREPTQEERDHAAEYLIRSLRVAEERMWASIAANTFGAPQHAPGVSDPPADPTRCARCARDESETPRTPTLYLNGESLCHDCYLVTQLENERRWQREAYKPPKAPEFAKPLAVPRKP